MAYLRRIELLRAESQLRIVVLCLKGLVLLGEMGRCIIEEL